MHLMMVQSKQALKAQGKSQRRGAAGVEFGNPAHLMDAAMKYVKEAWNAISPATIRNALHKADLKMILGVESPINNLEVQDINGFNSLNIDITTADFEATLDLDTDENSEYQSAQR